MLQETLTNKERELQVIRETLRQTRKRLMDVVAGLQII